WAHRFEPFLIGIKPNSPDSEIHYHYEGNWVYLFSDGVVARVSGNIFAGGVVRDLGYKKVRIQTDKLEVVRALSMEETVDSGITLLRRVKRFLRSEGQWEIKYVPRECNLIADQLAMISLSWQTSLQIFEVPPDLVVTAIQQDKAFRVS
ncbi:hypothetical protein Golax_020519, partial [Gossypium laxum]|nr:hypothetical protein [Gossypium laxum]